MCDKKKIAFYGFLTSGHMNFCTSVASTLLNLYSKDVEVYFFTDTIWAEKLFKIDSRFKFEIYGYENKGQENNIKEMINKMEAFSNLSYMERMKELYKSFNNNFTFFDYIDKEVSKLIKKLKPDFLLCDMNPRSPSMIESKIPYSFIISSNPLVLDIEDLPPMGLDYGVDEKEKIKTGRLELKSLKDDTKKIIEENMMKRNIIYDEKYPLDIPRSDYFSFYIYPKELDYFDDKTRADYKILQVDSPIVSSRVPLPYELPKNFSELPEKTIYVTLGSLFSCYHEKIQKLLDMLATLPYKYIVSKGPNGDKIKFPNNRFIGENYINQLAVLQVVDMIISHGGNNTFTECFYFGVPALIFPVMADQINNAKRIEETGFGFQMNLMNYSKEELEFKIKNILNNKTLLDKNKKISQRIKEEKLLDKAVEKFYESLKKL